MSDIKRTINFFNKIICSTIYNRLKRTQSCPHNTQSIKTKKKLFPQKLINQFSNERKKILLFCCFPKTIISYILKYYQTQKTLDMCLKISPHTKNYNNISALYVLCVFVSIRREKTPSTYLYCYHGINEIIIMWKYTEKLKEEGRDKKPNTKKTSPETQHFCCWLKFCLFVIHLWKWKLICNMKIWLSWSGKFIHLVIFLWGFVFRTFLLHLSLFHV